LTNRDKHIIPPGDRRINSFVKSIIVLCLAVLFFRHDALFAQVISNTGAAISITSGIVVNSKDIENTAGTLGNNGTINLSGNYSNAGTTNGDGFYNIIGNWTNLGSFNAGTSTVTLQGVADQTITHGSSGETFYILTINNPGRIITQVALPGNTLGVLKDFNLTAGTLSLGPTTSNLTVGGKATIAGALIYNNITTQTTTIADILSGAGSIDMSGGNLPHFLNLAGATNAIGTFTTSASGSSTVNYNGTTQTVFAAANYRNLTISNSGIKTLQGNSTVGVNLNISGGTFDLGTTTTSLPVFGNTSINGSLRFNGTTTKTVSLTGSLSGTGSINMSGGNLPHLLNLTGSTNSIGSYSSGNGSLVNYIRNGDQTVFTSDDYRNLTISGTGVKTLLYGDVTAKGILTMSAGDINSNGNTLKVSNSAIGAIIRTAGTVIGKLQRAIGYTGSEYLYPIGSATVYNPLKLTFQNLTAGPLTAQFKTEDIGTAGLPLDDDGNEIYDRYTTGYWSLTSVAPMASGSFNVNLNYTGFLGIDLSSSIIKRTNGGNLELDGTHGTIAASEITRTILLNGISTTTTDLAIGKGRPRITDQPQNIDICDGFDAFFEVKARGRGTLTYQWQVNTGSGFTNILNGGVYSGATTKKLILTGAPYGMNGYLYQCIITDNQGHPNTTNTVLLTVNKIPVATATPSAQNECPGVAFTNIVLGTSNDVPGTSFAWSFTTPAGITTTLPNSGTTFDIISGTFTNTTDAPITVTFTIVPTGPATTFCVGLPITATVTVNPTPRVFTPPASIQCDITTTSIQLTSPSTFTSGLVSFKYTVTTTGSVTGYTTPTTGLPNNHFITDNLVNQTDVYQIVTYRVVPVSPVGCIDGPAQNATVTVNPTPRAIPVNLKPAICFGGTTEIVLTTPTVMTSGAIRFDYTVSVTGGPGIVTGNIAPETDRTPGYKIVFPYQNYSDTLQSVYYSITPKVDNAICVPGNIFVSEVKVHALPLQQLLMPKTLTCEGGSDAILTAVLAKGTSPFNVVWDGPFDYHVAYSTNEESTDALNLKGGIYSVQVTDNLGCTNNDYQYISGARLDSYLFANPKVNGYGTTCPGSVDGELWIEETTSSTGIAPFTYKIVYNNLDTVISNTLNTTDVFQKYYNLPSGNYKLFITDANGCYNIDFPEVNIAPPHIITVEFGKNQYQGGFNVSCKGYNDGSVWINTITGGSGGYRYKWSTFDGTITGIDTLNRLDNITAGKYYLTTTDILGCIKIDSVTLTEPDGMLLAGSELSLSPDGNTSISCNGGNDGFIKLTISGGSGVYTYSWTSPNGFTATTRDISGLKAGNYTCTVRDLNGCILTPSPSFTLTQPAILAIASTSSTSNDGSFNINCNGGTGRINITVSGGSAGTYIYNWSTTNGSGIINGQEDQNTLTAGTYHLTVTDLNGCVTIKDITLTQPPSLGTQLSATHITCQAPGFNNGSINLSVSGGVAPYSYSWSNGSVTEDIAGLTQGYYNVTVTYNNSCMKTDSISVNLPPTLKYTKNLSDYNGYNINCNGLANGSIQINPSSGLAPFVYNWTGPDGFTATTKDISDLKAGQYNLLITDSNYCTATETIDLTEPGRLGMTISLSTSIAGGFNINCAGDSTGFIGIEPLNQVKTVDYLWSDGIFGKTRMNLPAGEYSVIITDANNCHASSTITLTEPDSMKLVFEISQPLCPDKPDGEIILNVTGGVRGTDYSYKWSDNSTGRNISNILKGFYKVTVKDLNGCSIKDSVKIIPLNDICLIIPNAISPNDDLINDVWNIGLIELYPAMEIKIFNRWGEIIWRSGKGYPQPWDGKSNGFPLPIDSYHYIIDLHNGSKPLVGNVTIVR
jgi:gliding motility-associated-like protein